MQNVEMKVESDKLSLEVEEYRKSLGHIIQRQKWVLEYLEKMARCGDGDAKNLYVGHCNKVLEFLVKEKEGR